MADFADKIFQTDQSPELTLKQLFEHGIATYNPTSHTLRIGVSPTELEHSKTRSGLHVVAAERCTMSYLSNDTCHIFNRERNYKTSYKAKTVPEVWQSVVNHS
jgi:hypothetical protein